MTRFRDFDGRVRPVERYGPTKGAARDALALALRDRIIVDGGAEITPDTRVTVVAEAWYASFVAQDRSPTTLAAYRDRLDRLIIPALGDLRLRELSVGVMDRHMRAIATRHGAATAKQTKTVLSQVCGLAVRHDALDRNPMHDTSSISTKPKKPPRALSEAQALQLKALLTYDDTAVTRDLPAFVSFMLATGLRIGEASAVRWQDIDFVQGTVSVNGTVIRIRGDGLRIKPSPKSKAGVRTLKLPAWCREMLRLRAATRVASVDDPVFPAPKGSLRDPSNTAADLKEAFTAAGYAWATSHTLRKTTATLLDKGGLTAREIADQLGHSKTSLTQDVYMGRGVVGAAASSVLEALKS
jgi:integrase